MQALIDFDGWRKWKEIATESNLKSAATPAASTPKPPPPKDPAKRQSLQAPPPPPPADGPAEMPA